VGLDGAMAQAGSGDPCSLADVGNDDLRSHVRGRERDARKPVGNFRFIEKQFSNERRGFRRYRPRLTTSAIAASSAGGSTGLLRCAAYPESMTL
jgi:hypothetical protein